MLLNIPTGLVWILLKLHACFMYLFFKLRTDLNINLILQEEASKFSRYPNTSVTMASYDTIEDEDELHKLVSRS